MAEGLRVMQRTSNRVKVIHDYSYRLLFSCLGVRRQRRVGTGLQLKPNRGTKIEGCSIPQGSLTWYLSICPHLWYVFILVGVLDAFGALVH